MKRTLCGVLIVLALSLTGCGKSANAGAMNVATTGEATFDQKPAAGAMLLFHPMGAESSLPSRAIVGLDGKFVVATNGADDGLPEGDYVVTVEWRIGSDENGAERRSMVPDKYVRKEWSPLRVSVRCGADGTCDLGTITLTK